MMADGHRRVSEGLSGMHSSRPTTSQSSTRFPSIDQPGYSGMPSTAPSTGRRGHSRGSLFTAQSVISEWRNDENLAEWYKNVQSRKKAEKQRSYKQAMKDANWVLERRARQMKEIRDRQKAEEAEATRMAMEEYQASQSKQFGDTSAKGAKGESAPGTSRGAANSKALQMQMQASHGFRPQLEWQAVSPQKSNLKRTKDVTVWIKPGQFIVKNVLVAPGNTFSR